MPDQDVGVPWGNAGCPGGKKIRSGGRGRGLGTGRGRGPVGRAQVVEKIQVIESFTKNKKPLRRRR